MWVGIGESYAENDAEEAMRAAANMLLDEVGTEVRGLLGSLSGSCNMDLAQISKAASIPCNIWKDVQYAWGMQLDDDRHDGLARVVLTTVGECIMIYSVPVRRLASKESLMLSIVDGCS